MKVRPAHYALIEVASAARLRVGWLLPAGGSASTPHYKPGRALGPVGMRCTPYLRWFSWPQCGPIVPAHGVAFTAWPTACAVLLLSFPGVGILLMLFLVLPAGLRCVGRRRGGAVRCGRRSRGEPPLANWPWNMIENSPARRRCVITQRRRVVCMRDDSPGLWVAVRGLLCAVPCRPLSLRHLYRSRVLHRFSSAHLCFLCRCRRRRTLPMLVSPPHAQCPGVCRHGRAFCAMPTQLGYVRECPCPCLLRNVFIQLHT